MSKAARSKRIPVERHKQRMSALYVDPVPGGWNRPTEEISQAFAFDYLQDAANDYSVQYDRYTNLEIYKPDDPELLFRTGTMGGSSNTPSP